MIDPSELVRNAGFHLQRVQNDIWTAIKTSPDVALSPIADADKDAHNQPLRIDYYAEDFVRAGLQRKFPKKITVVGEESLKKDPRFRDLANHRAVVALMDIIDGTDLLLRGLSNWCSAIVFFYPPEKRILASVVRDHLGDLFFASEGDNTAWFQPRGSNSPCKLHTDHSPKDRHEAVIRKLRHQPSGPLRNTALRDSSLAFYGQKPKAFLSTQREGFLRQVRDFAKMSDTNERPSPAFRIYNLGGIPMMLNVANGILDAVFDLTGPKPHDVVPGAYIALKAGAYLGDVNGNRIGESELAASLIRPDEGGPPYILSGSAVLYEELAKSFA